MNWRELKSVVHFVLHRMETTHLPLCFASWPETDALVAVWGTLHLSGQRGCRNHMSDNSFDFRIA